MCAGLSAAGWGLVTGALAGDGLTAAEATYIYTLSCVSNIKMYFYFNPMLKKKKSFRFLQVLSLSTPKMQIVLKQFF